jgi:hypothetical protein
MPKDSYKSEFEIAAEAQESHSPPTETTRLLDDDYLRVNDHYAAAGAVESEIIEAYGSGRRASVFTIPKNRRVSYDTSAAEHHPQVRNPVTGAMHGKKSFEQIKSPWWMYHFSNFAFIDSRLMSLFVMLMMVRINYYIATVWPKARYLLGDEGGEKVNHLFDVALPRMISDFSHLL